MSAFDSVNRRIRTDYSEKLIWGKYLLTTGVASLTWLYLAGVIMFPTLVSFSKGNEILFVGMVLTAIPGVLIHRHAPANPNDWYHKLGIWFAMLLVANGIVTVAFFVVQIANPNMSLPSDFLEIARVTIAYVAISSLFLPGPYAGLLIGRRWSKK